MKYCPKCEEGFFNFCDLEWCHTHKKEYDSWLNDQYVPLACCCGSEEFIDGEMQLTHPATYPMKKIFRCASCNLPRVEESYNSIRIIDREDKE